MATSARVSLRAPPHLPFVQGWPGIPEDGQGRKQPAVQGTVEVRVGNAPVKAKWVRVELRKYETLPGAINQGQTIWTHVGQICDLWKAAEGKEWELLQTADYKFHLPLPDNIPPTIEFPKGGGIHYELVAAICYRHKGGLLKKESSPIMKTTEIVRVLKHELHSAWPLYLVPDTRTTVKDGIHLSVHRPTTAFGPTDRVMLSAAVHSERAQPLRLQGFLAQIFEHSTFHVPPAKRVKASTTVRSRTIAEVRVPVNEMLGTGHDQVRRMALEIPAERMLVTTNNAKLIEVQYELCVKAVLEGSEEVKVDKLRYIVGVFPRNHAVQAVRDIGYFSALCPNVPPPHPMTPTSSIHSSQQQQQQFQPSPPPQQPLWNPHANGNPMVPPMSAAQAQTRPPVDPFPAQQWRRPSSTGSTVTTQTTQTHRQSMDFSPAPSERPYSTVGSPTPSQPATYQPGLASRSQSYASVPLRDDDPTKRYSSQSFGTFGGGRPPISRPPSDCGTDLSGTGAGDHESQMSTSSRPQQRFSIANADPKPRPIRARHSVGGSAGPSANMLSGSSSTSPRPWQSAEDEKARLYAEARARAAQTQHDGGASLTRIGMDSAIPTSDPPEYAPQATFPVPLPASVSPPTSPPGRVLDATPSLPKSHVSAIEEKEQQRQRFELAQRRAVSGGRPSALEAVGENESEFTARPSSVAPPPSAWSGHGHSPQIPQLETTAEEKDRLRYRMAIERREQFSGEGSASGSAGPAPAIDEPVPYDALYPVGPPVVGSSSNPQAAPPVVAQGAVDEKEQMRRYHEAQERVAALSVGGSSASAHIAPPITPTFASPPVPSPAASNQNSPNPNMYISAEQEKDMMRRRYEEATQAVSKGHSRDSSLSGPSSHSAPVHDFNQSPAASSSIAGLQQYMSAEEEKAMMRRRFEEATNAVNRSRQSMSPPRSPAPVASASVPIPLQAYKSVAEEKDLASQRFQDATGAVSRAALTDGLAASSSTARSDVQRSPGASVPQYMSANDEKDMMRKRYEAATTAVNRGVGSSVLDGGMGSDGSMYGSRPVSPQHNRPVSPPQQFARDPTVRAGKAKAMRPTSAEFDEPPPPLPARPPAEYITLLSPVDGMSSEQPPWAQHYGPTAPLNFHRAFKGDARSSQSFNEAGHESDLRGYH